MGSQSPRYHRSNTCCGVDWIQTSAGQERKQARERERESGGARGHAAERARAPHLQTSGAASSHARLKRTLVSDASLPKYAAVANYGSALVPSLFFRIFVFVLACVVLCLARGRREAAKPVGRINTISRKGWLVGWLVDCARGPSGRTWQRGVPLFTPTPCALF